MIDIVGPYGEAPRREVIVMLDNFPEKGGSMGERGVRKSLKRQNLSSASFPRRSFLGRVDPSRMGEGEKDQNQILRFAGGTPGPYRRFSHGCCR
jgi:hypothetical protein